MCHYFFNLPCQCHSQERGGGALSYSSVHLHCEENKIAPVLTPDSLKDEQFLQDVRDLGADVFVVVAFSILPEVLFSIPEYREVKSSHLIDVMPRPKLIDRGCGCWRENIRRQCADIGQVRRVIRIDHVRRDRRRIVWHPGRQPRSPLRVVGIHKSIGNVDRERGRGESACIVL